MNTTPSIAVLIPDRTASTRSHLPWWSFPEAMDPGQWSHMEKKSPEVSIRFAFCSCVNLCCTNREQIFRLPKSWRTMVCAVSLLMPNSSAINLSVSRRSCARICRTFSIISRVLLVDGRPERGSSSVVSFPSAQGFPPVHLHRHSTRLRCSFPQFIPKIDVCTLLHCAVTLPLTLTTFNWPAVGLHYQSHAVHDLCRFSPCIWRTIRMRAHMRKLPLRYGTIYRTFYTHLVHWRKWKALHHEHLDRMLPNWYSSISMSVGYVD